MKRKPMSKSSYLRGVPVTLNYVPFNDAKSLQKFLNDLAKWTLSRRITPRECSACKGLAQTFLASEGYQEVSKRLHELEVEGKLLDEQVEALKLRKPVIIRGQPPLIGEDIDAVVREGGREFARRMREASRKENPDDSLGETNQERG